MMTGRNFYKAKIANASTQFIEIYFTRFWKHEKDLKTVHVLHKVSIDVSCGCCCINQIC